MAIRIEQLNARFEGEFKFRGRTVSIPFALPGDLVQFRVTGRRRKQRVEVLHIERSENYPDHILTRTPFCPLHGRCGGCPGQHLAYETQLGVKTAPVAAKMKSEFSLEPVVLPAPVERGHRNRMDFVVEGEIVGMRPIGDFSSFVDVAFCPIQKPAANEALRLCRSLLLECPGVGFRRYSAGAGSDDGPLKYITIRQGHESGAVVLTVAPGPADGAPYRAFREGLLKRLSAGEIADCRFSVIEAESSMSSELSCVPGGRALLGGDCFRDGLGGGEFDVPYDSFFQPNTTAFDRLLVWCGERLREALFDSGDGAVSREQGALLDLYSGAGVLSAVITRNFPGAFNRVVGYDFAHSSVARAPDNLKDFPGEIDFQTADLNRPGPDLFQGPANTAGNKCGGGIRLVIIDPPRAGMSPRLGRLMRKSCRAPLVLYISCNPASQMRDLAELLPTYEVRAACIMDCFPHTPHLEQAVLLRRR